MSAVALIGVVAGVIWLAPSWATAGLAALAAGVAAFELGGLAETTGAPVPRLFLAASAAVVCLSCVGPGDGSLNGRDAAALEIALLTVVMASAAVSLGSGRPDASALLRAAVSFMAPVYIGLPLGMLARTHAIGGAAMITWFLVVMAVSDSAQYYSGRAFGRRKLAPAVSPAKTVEGAIGGVAAAALAGAALAPALISTRAGTAGAIAVVLAALGMVGDLFESLLKRSAGVKDSSALIPGHGGVLDRIDSYLVAAPFYYLFVRYLA